MGPTSVAFFTVLVLAVGALALAMVRARPLALKVASGVLAFGLAALVGVAGVNAYFQYFQTWGEIFSPPAAAATAALTGPLTRPASYLGRRSGQLLRVSFDGALSGITRPGYVYLPPQYGDPRYAHVRFPVLELLHGWPGQPADEITVLHVVAFEEEELAARRIGPVILLMPSVNGAPGQLSEECVNAVGGAQDDTYLSTDLHAWVAAHLPQASTDGASWGLLGYSEGGFCAVNLALRHPDLYGAAISLDGYFHAEQDLTTGDLYGGSRALRLANDPFHELATYPAGRPLPALFLVANQAGFYRDQASAFHALASRLEEVPYVVQPGAHTYPAWRAALPMVLDWAWHTLAAGDLAHLFPTLPPVTGRGEYTGVSTPLPARIFDAGLSCPPEVTIVTAPRPVVASPTPTPSRLRRSASPTASPTPTRPRGTPSAQPSRAGASPTPTAHRSATPTPSPSPTSAKGV